MPFVDLRPSWSGWVGQGCDEWVSHKLSENIWFAWSKPSINGEKVGWHRYLKNNLNNLGKIALLSSSEVEIVRIELSHNIFSSWPCLMFVCHQWTIWHQVVKPCVTLLLWLLCLLLQCSFQHWDTPYISTSLEFAVKFGLKCWYFHLIFSVLSFDKCMFTIGSCGLTFYCFHGGRALHSYTHTHTHTHMYQSQQTEKADCIRWKGTSHPIYLSVCVWCVHNRNW